MKTRRFILSAVLLSAMAFTFTSCSELVKKMAMKAVSESAEFEKDTVQWGGVVEQHLDLPTFAAIDAKGAVRIVYTQDSVFSVRVRANEKCLEAYMFEVRKDELKVQAKDATSRNNVNRSSPAVTLFISAPSLSDIEIAGAGKLELTGTIVQDGPLDIEMAGAGDVSIEDLTSESLNIELSGAAKCDIAKATTREDIEIEVNGAGDINVNVFCKDLTIELNGAGNAVVSGECKNFVCEENGASKVDFSKLKR